ncbi:MAG TPA: SPOR domain-containing protein [Sphingobium sp.]|nr:SPOR domain-containing protein [Sphingobium sp.]
MPAPRIEKALADKKYDRALTQAEELVAATPQDASYRSILGRAYLANGRYVSARAAFRDAIMLGHREIRTIVSLSLAETALGDAQAAQAVLVAHISDLPAADYGLAMAMAGNVEEGVRALVEATRQPDATAQTRQNLAYALALGGAWGQARLIAGQDLPARAAEQRMGEWSRGGTGQERVIAMLGVAPHGDDAGLPARLALRSGADDPSAIAQGAAGGDLVTQARADAAAAAAAAAAEVVVASAAVEPKAAAMAVTPDRIAAPAVPSAQTMPVDRVAAPVLAEPAALAVAPDAATLAAIFAHDEGTPALADRAASDPMREAAHAAFQRKAGPAPMATKPAAARAVAKAAAGDVAVSDWVVQLGAFDSVAIAREKWQQISKRQPRLGGFGEVLSEITVNGRVFHRLAIRGFGDRNMASATCRSLTAAGQACFVRLDDGAGSRMARGGAPGNGQRIATR